MTTPRPPNHRSRAARAAKFASSDVSSCAGSRPLSIHAEGGEPFERMRGGFHHAAVEWYWRRPRFLAFTSAPQGTFMRTRTDDDG
jgi:hypothetical protein